MSRQLESLLEESGVDVVDRAELRDELGSLLGLVDAAPPSPSPELAALLGLHPPLAGRDGRGPGPDGHGSVAPVVPLHRARPAPQRLTGPRGAVTGAVVLAVATVGATGISAAANSLPAPLQRHAADLSRTYLPFDFPEPRSSPGARPVTEAPPRPESRGPLADGRDGRERDARPAQDARVPTTTRGGAERPTVRTTAEAGAVAPRSPATADAGPRRAAAPEPHATAPGHRPGSSDRPAPTTSSSPPPASASPAPTAAAAPASPGGGPRKDDADASEPPRSPRPQRGEDGPRRGGSDTPPGAGAGTPGPAASPVLHPAAQPATHPAAHPGKAAAAPRAAAADAAPRAPRADVGSLGPG